MAAPVQRTSGPQPIEELRNGELSWMIPLSAFPSREWLKFFNTPESESVCMPSRVAFRERSMVFSAREEQITEWVKSIDAWIATANERVAHEEGQRGRTEDRQQRGVADAKRRLADADRYRNL